ncbi:hypothetical protein MHYP_G00365120 [Metynnis hypsauchen]
MAEPMLSLTVGHLRLPFLIDTGATYSAINSQLPPDGLWSEGPDDVGQIKQTPVLFNMTSAQPIWLLQYRHKPEAMASLDQTIDALLKAGVLEPCQSGWNTPILPVPKKEPGQYRMAHDLRAINAALATQTIPVPNPYTALSELDHNKTWFTCIDLANAFFCVPVHETCRDICAFTHRGRQYRYTRLPQGFALSPGLFNQALKQSLDTCSLPEGSILIQYVDDLLIAGDTQQACIEASVAVLEKLAECGYKVSKQKLQFCRPRVTFLGRVVTKGSTGMSPQHRSSILSHAKPITVRDMLAFLGLVGYSRSYIPDFTGRTAPLREMVRSKGKSETDTPPEVALSEWVYLKVIKRKWCEPRWTGPYRVVERTSHAVRLNGKGPVWYHLSQCRPAHPPKAEKESPLNGAE